MMRFALKKPTPKTPLFLETNAERVHRVEPASDRLPAPDPTRHHRCRPECAGGAAPASDTRRCGAGTAPGTRSTGHGPSVSRHIRAANLRLRFPQSYASGNSYGSPPYQRVNA